MIIIWFMVTSVPLMETGLFSARYRGTIILARPTPPPTTNLDGERTVLVVTLVSGYLPARNSHWSLEKARMAVPAMKMTLARMMVGFLPTMSLMIPPMIQKIIQVAGVAPTEISFITSTTLA